MVWIIKERYLLRLRHWFNYRHKKQKCKNTEETHDLIGTSPLKNVMAFCVIVVTIKFWSNRRDAETPFYKELFCYWRGDRRTVVSTIRRPASKTPDALPLRRRGQKDARRLCLQYSRCNIFTTVHTVQYAHRVLPYTEQVCTEKL